MNPSISTSAEERTVSELLALRVQELQLALDAAALERVGMQWQRLEAMARLVCAEPLDDSDEPAMTFIP
ncbi:MAG: AtzG-like protein [Thiomonas sp.]